MQASVPAPKSLWFRRRSVGCFSRRERSAHIWIDTGRASNAEKQPTGRGPEGCVENGPAAALLVGYVSIQICALLAPCRRLILNSTTSSLYERPCTRAKLRIEEKSQGIPLKQGQEGSRECTGKRRNNI